MNEDQKQRFNDSCSFNMLELYTSVTWCICAFTKAIPLVLDDYWHEMVLWLDILLFYLSLNALNSF